MAEWGTFEYLSSPGGGDGGEGGGVLTTVTVPGNAEEVIERAVGTGLIVAYVDDDHVTVSLPAEATVAEMFQLSMDINNVFAAPLGTGELGWLTVTAAGIFGMADSSDAGGDPDYIPVVGTVTISSTLSKPLYIAATGQFLAVSSVTAILDSDGELSYDGIKTVRIIAPQWAGLSNTAWKWEATVKPGAGQSWGAFTVQFTGHPGDVVNLASLLV